MARYHVNPRTYEYGICHAEKGKCPFGEENHYGSELEASRAAELKSREDSAHGGTVSMAMGKKPVHGGTHWQKELFEHYDDAIAAYEYYDESMIEKAGKRQLDMWIADREATEERINELDERIAHTEEKAYDNTYGQLQFKKKQLNRRLEVLDEYIDGYDQNIADRHQSFRLYGESLREYGDMLAAIDAPDIRKQLSPEESHEISSRAFQRNRQYIHDEMFDNEYEWDESDPDGNCQYWVDYMNDDVAVIGIHSCWDPEEIDRMVEDGELDESQAPVETSWYFFVNPKTGEIMNKDWTMYSIPEEKPLKTVITENLDGTESMLNRISTSYVMHDLRLVPLGGSLKKRK